MQKKYMNPIVAGVDEVGHGPLAGPVVAAAVILAPKRRYPGVKDSKLLTEKKREELYALISEKALAISVGRVEVEEIDTINIYHAALLAMKRAVEGLAITPQLALIDGKVSPQLHCDSRAIVRGDKLERVISAASIIAKVTRDREMYELDKLYPGYFFADHKGYSTKKHLQALKDLGPCPIHRKSFAPVRACHASFRWHDTRIGIQPR